MVPPKTEADETAPNAVDEQKAGDDASEVEDDDASEHPVPGARWPMVAIGLAIVFGLIASVMTASYIRLRSDRDTSSEDRTAVATVAAQVAEAMTAIDATGDNQTEADVVRRHGSGPLIEQYNATIPAIRPLLVAVKVTSERGQITPGGVYVGDIDSGQAQVIVVLDLVVVGENTKVVPNQYLRMHLVKLNGEWKVDNVSDVNTALAAQASGSTATTTTVPATGSSSSSG